MAKNGNIDPAFQAAPYLGDSSHNPIEFARRQSMIKYQERRRKQEEINQNIAKGLDQLMIDLKGWDDKEGLDEIMQRQDKAYKMYTNLAMKGVNFVTPKTIADVTAFKALTDYQTETKELVDIRNNHKVLLELSEKAMKEDSLKPIEEQRIDQELSRVNIIEAKKDNTLRGRDEKFHNILVPKVQTGDVVKQIIADKDFYIPASQRQTVKTNPDTGKNETVFEEYMDPEDEKENIRRAGVRYTGLSEAMKKGVSQMREAEVNPLLYVMQDKDYYATLAVPTYRKRFIEKVTGGGNNDLAIKFGGQKVKMSPGKFREEPIPYGDKTYTGSYMFQTTKSLTVPVGTIGSAQFMGANWAPIEKGGTIEGTPYLYNPATDEFVFNVTSNQKAPWVENNRPVSVPRSVIGDLADEFPIEVNGKVRKLKDIYGSMKQVKLKIPGVDEDFWGAKNSPVYIPKNRK